MYPSHSADGHLSGQRLGDTGPAEISNVTPAHLPAELNPIPSTSDATRAATYAPSVLRVFKADRVPRGRSLGLALIRRNSLERRVSLDLNPSISIVSSFLLPTIPPELRIPLSFLGEEKLQVQFSETDATDLDMRGCVL